MQKITWYITTPQKDALKALSERTGLTMSDLMRRSIDEYLRQNNYEYETDQFGKRRLKPFTS